MLKIFIKGIYEIFRQRILGKLQIIKLNYRYN